MAPRLQIVIVVGIALAHRIGPSVRFLLGKQCQGRKGRIQVLAVVVVVVEITTKGCFLFLLVPVGDRRGRRHGDNDDEQRPDNRRQQWK